MEDTDFKVRVIIESLDADGDSHISVDEARKLFADLLDVEADEIPADNQELIMFVEGDHEERCAKIKSAMQPAEINAYYERALEDKRPPPNKKKVTAILEFLEVDGFTVEEAKQLFSEILDVEVDWNVKLQLDLTTGSFRPHRQRIFQTHTLILWPSATCPKKSAPPSSVRQ